MLVYCPVFKPTESGYTHAFEALITNFLDHGFMVHVLTPHHLDDTRKEVMQHERLTVIRYKPTLNIWALGLFYTYYMLAKRMVYLQQQNKYDLVFCETGDDPLLYFFLPKWFMKKTVVRFHSTSDTEYLHVGKHFKYHLRRWFWRLLSSSSIKHLCATNAYHLQYAAERIINAKYLYSQHVVTNTVPVYPTSAVKNRGIHFFMLGRMDEEGYKQKGFEDLLQALSLIDNQLQQAHIKITIVGNGSKYGDFKYAIKRFPYVSLYHEMSREQVLQLLTETDVVILPSRYEGVSMFALEALATANAVIYAATGGLIDMVKGNGILVQPNHPKELAAAILAMLAHSDLEALKEQSKAIASKQYSKEVQWQQLENVLSEVAHVK